MPRSFPSFLHTFATYLYSVEVPPSLLQHIVQYVTKELDIKPHMVAYVTKELDIKPHMVAYVTKKLDIKPDMVAYVMKELVDIQPQRLK